MFSNIISEDVSEKPSLPLIEEKIQEGWQLYCNQEYDQAANLFQENMSNLLLLKTEAFQLDDVPMITQLSPYEFRLKLAIYFCLCHKADVGISATQYANHERLFSPGSVQFEEIIISNQAIVAKNTDGFKLIQPEYAASFEKNCRAGNVDPSQIVADQIFKDGNHRTAIWYIYLSEIKTSKIKYADCEAYKLYATLARDRYFQANHREPAGFKQDAYQQQYVAKRTRDIDGARASTMRYEKFLEIFRLDRFLFRLIGDGSADGRKSFKHHFLWYQHRGVGSADTLYDNMQFLDPPLVAAATFAQKRGIYEQWKRYYRNFIALGGAGGGDGANL